MAINDSNASALNLHFDINKFRAEASKRCKGSLKVSSYLDELSLKLLRKLRELSKVKQESRGFFSFLKTDRYSARIKKSIDALTKKINHWMEEVAKYYGFDMEVC